MQENASQDLQIWKDDLESAWREMPKAFRNEHSVLRTLQCHLYGRLQQAGFATVADYMPPRIADRPVDLIALKGDGEVVYAVCLDVLVSLAAVKSLSSFASIHKLIFTIGPLEKKVMESRFFLKPDIQHIHLKPFSQ